MRYTLVVVFLLLSLSSSALAISTDPFGMAGDISKYTSCVISTVFRLAFVLLIPGVVVLLLHKFMQIERMRQTGEIYMDELISLFAIGFAVALIIRLVGEALTFYGVPVEKLMHDVLYCNAEFVKNGEVKCKRLVETSPVPACDGLGFGEMSQFVLAVATALTRLFLIFVVVFAIFIAGVKIFAKQYRLYRERRQTATYSLLKASVDFMVLLIITLIFTYSVYGIIYVDHPALTKWFFEVVAKQLGLGGQS